MNDPVIKVFRSEILTKIIEFIQPDGIILFGSRVQGNAHDELVGFSPLDK